MDRRTTKAIMDADPKVFRPGKLTFVPAPPPPMRIADDELKIAKLDLKPGDTLVIKVSSDWTAEQCQQAAEHYRALVGDAYDAKVMLVPGDLAIVRADDTLRKGL